MPIRLQSATPPDLHHSPSTADRERAAMLPVVDPHMRIGDPVPHGASAAEPLAPLRELLDRTVSCHLLRAVHVQQDMAWEDALADIARVQAIARTPGSGGLPHGIVACCELAGGDAEERLDALMRHPNLRGVRLPAGSAPPPDLAPLARRDLVLELRADAVAIEDVVRAAAARPDCRLVLDDTGPWHDDDTDGLRPRDAWHRLGSLDNVVLKLGYRQTGDPSHDTEHLGALVGRAIEAVGPARVMLASGCRGGDLQRPWHATWRAFAVATRGIAASRRNALFRTNAIRTYRL